MASPMRLLRWLGFWSLPVVAVAMVALALVPVGTWGQAERGAVYSGLDPNLIYASDHSPGAANEGRVSVSDERLSLVAESASEPVAHLLTTPLSFNASMNVRVSESPPASRPLRIAVWSVRDQAAYYLDFGPAPNNDVTARVVEEGEVVSEVALGSYDLDQTYRLELSLDRENDELETSLRSVDAVPAVGALRLDGGPANPGYGDAVSDPVPIRPGQDYSFGSRVRVTSGADSYKIAIKWLDQDMESLGFSNSWRGVGELKGWTDVEFQATAPDEAAAAQVFLGSGNGTSILFSGIFLQREGDDENLLPNGDLLGTRAWKIAEDKGRPEIVRLTPIDSSSAIGVQDAPLLFDSYRLTLTASSFAAGDPASAELEEFSLELPPELWQVVKTDDDLARILVTLLLAAGVLALGLRLALWARQAFASRSMKLPDGPVTLWPSRTLLTVGLLILAYLGLNMLLMSVARHPFDMTSARIWSYLGVEYGLRDIYARASTVSLAEVWNGAPYHDAVFPYLPVLAYHYTGLGWLYNLTLAGPGPLQADSFGLEFLIKTANVLFGLASAVLIYLIARQARLGQRAALVTGAIFLFNPALWIDMTFWGATETVSLSFILLSVWLAERDSPIAAWVALGAAALTRPQMAVLVVLLGLVYVRKFAWRRNVEAVSWTVVGSFIVMAPFLFYFAPSFPIDYVKRMSDVQLAGGAEMALVSKGAYNIWPLVTGLVEGQSGLGRLQFPEDATLVGGLGYGQISNIMMMALVAAIGAVFLLRPKTSRAARNYLPLLALGMLGWSMFLTDMGARYLIYALGLTIASRPALRTIPYFAVVGALTATVTVTTYGVLALAIETVPHLAPALHSSNNPITSLVMDVYGADWFITFGVLVNTGALALLLSEVMRTLLPTRETSEPTPQAMFARGWSASQVQGATTRAMEH